MAALALPPAKDGWGTMAKRGFAAAVTLCFIQGVAAQYANCTISAVEDIGNGVCNEALNIPLCGYDGGDCCECSCVDGPVYSCGIVGFDCQDPVCFDPAVVAEFPLCTGDGILIGDGDCNPDTNVDSCGYDGGDCCPCSCSGSACAFSVFDCLDPDADDELYECEAPPSASLPCSAEVQREWVVYNAAQAQALTRAVNCSGGSFEVEWRGTVVVDEPIYVADGTTLNISGVAGSIASIDGNSSTRLFTVVNAALHLDGLNVSYGSSTAGGAIAASGSTLTFNRTNFVGNIASGGGGAVFVSDASNVSCARGTTFVENRAGTNGGAMFASGGSGISCGGWWLSNSAVGRGGAIRVEDESSVSWSEESVFELNTAGSAGGALEVTYSSRVSWDAPTSFYYNSAGIVGGGLLVTLQSVVSWQAETTVFISNAASESGGSVAVSGDSNVSWSGDGNTVFDGNEAGFAGGAFSVVDSSLVSWSGDGKTTFIGNEAGQLGGAFRVGDSSHVSWSGDGDSTFDGNEAGFAGGAFSVVDSSLVSYSGDGNAVFSGNQAGQQGGAFWVATSSHVLWSSDGDSTFDGNEAGVAGGAFSVVDSSLVSYSGDGNAVFSGNQAGQEGGAFSVGLGSDIVWSGDVNTVFNGNQAGQTGGAFVADSSNVSWNGNGNTVFNGNQAGRFGGAFVADNSYVSWGSDGNTVFTENQAGQFGGALFMSISTVLWKARATTAFYNTAVSGGALVVFLSRVTWNGQVAMAFNNASDSGGAMFISSESNISFVGQTNFSSNAAGLDGGALHISFSSTAIWIGDATFAENDAGTLDGKELTETSGLGGAMSVIANSGVVWGGGTTQFIGNVAGGFGSALYTLGGARASWGGPATEFVNNSAGGWGTLYVAEAEVSWSGETLFEGNSASSGAAFFLFNGSYVGWTGETTFSSNKATIDGGAVASHASDPTYNPRDSTIAIGATTTFSNNTSGANGGGLSLLGACSLEVDPGVEVSYVGNSAEVAGGAVFMSGAGTGPVFSSTTFVSNSAQAGGAVSIFGSGNSKGATEAEPPNPTTFDRCRFVGNRATTGGAIDSAAGYDSIVDSIFEDNAAGTGGALRLAGTASIGGCSFVENFSDDGRGAVVSNIGTISGMANISFGGNGFSCPSGMFLDFAPGDPYEAVCDNCPIAACEGCVFAEPLLSPICKEVIAHSTSSGGKTTLEKLSIERGYWRATSLSETIRACFHPDACLGGQTGTFDYCLEGYEGPYCAICSEGYATRFGFVCSECSSSAAGVVLAVVLAVVAVVAAVAVVWYATTGKGNGKGRLIERVARYIPLQSVKIVIVAWQILTQFTAMANATYPRLYQTFLDALNVFNFDLSWILSAGCIVDIDFHDRLLMSTMGPIVAVLFLGSTYAAAARIHKGATDTLQNVRHKHVSLVLLLTFVVYSSVSSVLFSAFACEVLEDEKFYLRSDYRIECDSPRHRGFQVYAWFMIVVYTVGIPAFYAALLFKDRDVLRQEKKDGGSAARVSSTSNLWQPYKPSVFYYEVIECVRRILLAGVVVFIYPNSAPQIAMTLMIAFAFVLVSEGLAPYASRWDHWISRTGHVVVITHMYVALLLKVDMSGEHSSSKKVFEAVLVVAHVALVLVVLVEAVVMGLALRAENREDLLPRLRTSDKSLSGEQKSEKEESEEEGQSWETYNPFARHVQETKNASS